MNFILATIGCNIIIQYVIILFSKNILTYNEELFLFSVYASLFFIILNWTPEIIKKYIIKESIRLNEFYEKLANLKIILINKLNIYIKIIKTKNIFKYIIYIIYSKNIKLYKKKILKIKKIKKLKIINNLYIKVIDNKL